MRSAGQLAQRRHCPAAQLLRDRRKKRLPAVEHGRRRLRIRNRVVRALCLACGWPCSLALTTAPVRRPSLGQATAPSGKATMLILLSDDHKADLAVLANANREGSTNRFACKLASPALLN